MSRAWEGKNGCGRGRVTPKVRQYAVAWLGALAMATLAAPVLLGGLKATALAAGRASELGQQPQSGPCTLPGPGDLNADGRVNALDVAEIGLRWRKEGAANAACADANRDGRVSGLDLSVVGLHWRQERSAPICRVAPQAMLLPVPVPALAEPGHVVDVTLMISTAVAIRTAQFSLRYDPAVLEAVGFEAGAFFRSWAESHGGVALVFPNPAPIDNTRGRLGVVSVTIMGGEAGGPSGQGVVGVVRLAVRPGAPGQASRIRFEDVVLGDTDLESVPDVALDEAWIGVLGPTVTPGSNPTGGPHATATATSEAVAPSATTSLAPLTVPAISATPQGTPTATAQATADATPSAELTPIATHTAAPTATASPTSASLPVATTTATVAPRVSVSLAARQQTVAPGSRLEVTVIIDTEAPVRTIQCALRFDPRAFEGVGFESGTFLSQWASANGGTALVFPSAPPIDQQAGKMGVISVSVMGGSEGGPTGRGEFGTFRLLAKAGATGESTLTLEEVVVGDAESEAMSSVAVSGTAVFIGGTAATATATTAVAASATATGTSGASATPSPTSPPQRTAVNTAEPTATPERRSQSTVRISPASQKVPPGSEFDVHVVLEPDQPIITAQCGLKFDPTLIEVKSVSEGELFKSYATSRGGTSLLYPTTPQINNTAGEVEVTSVTVMGAGAGGPSTSGTFLTYRMLAKTGVSGTSPLTLGSVELGDAQSDPLSGFSVVNGQVTVDANAPTLTASPSATGTQTVQATSSGTPLLSARATATVKAGLATANATAQSVVASPLPTPMPAAISVAGKVSTDNTLRERIAIQSGLAGIVVEMGTRIQMVDGQPVGDIRITALDRVPAPPKGRVIVGFGYAYEPSGATFEPPAKISLGYDSRTLPRGCRPSDLKLAYYDDGAGGWMELESALDVEQETVSAMVDHFTIFALLGRKRGTNWWLVGGIVAAEALLGVGAAWFVLRRRRLATMVAVGGWQSPSRQAYERRLRRPSYAARGHLAPGGWPEMAARDSREPWEIRVLGFTLRRETGKPRSSQVRSRFS